MSDCYGLRIVALQGIIVDPNNRKIVMGSWLESFDPEAYGGRGSATWTTNPKLAMRFVSAAAAMQCYQQIPRNRPLRADGKANRPLTAFTIMCEQLP